MSKKTMGYLYLMIIVVIFSFGGILIKTCGLMFSPYEISFIRFFIGVLLLLLIQGVGKKWKSNQKSWWFFGSRFVFLGGICKALHYLGENYGVMHGFSYGNVLIWPVQTVVVLILSALVFREKVSVKSVIGSVLCMVGIGIITWNGAPVSIFLGDNLRLLAVFAAAGVGSAGFAVCQKKLLNRVGTLEMNSSMFAVGALVCLLFLPFQEAPDRAFHWQSLAAMLVMGGLTSFGFLLQAEAMKTVPLYMVTVIQSMTVILSLIWAVLFFHEPVTGYILWGTGIFFAGMLLVNLKLPARRAVKA